MNYAQMRKYDIANGPGIRSSLFVSGCTHGCKGCFNQAYMNFNYGKPWTEDAKNEFIAMIKDEQVKGVTILGGEPMDQLRDDDMLLLLQAIKGETGKNIWLYSGYTFEEIMSHPQRKKMLTYVDVLVDGRFEEGLKDFRLSFRGSSNQQIIDVAQSLIANQPIKIAKYHQTD